MERTGQMNLGHAMIVQVKGKEKLVSLNNMNSIRDIYTKHLTAPQHFYYAVLWKHGTKFANGLWIEEVCVPPN